MVRRHESACKLFEHACPTMSRRKVLAVDDARYDQKRGRPEGRPGCRAVGAGGGRERAIPAPARRSPNENPDEGFLYTTKIGLSPSSIAQASAQQQAICLLLAVVAVGVGAATVAVVDEAGGGHPEGLHMRRHFGQDRHSLHGKRDAHEHHRRNPALKRRRGSMRTPLLFPSRRMHASCADLFWEAAPVSHSYRSVPCSSPALRNPSAATDAPAPLSILRPCDPSPTPELHDPRVPVPVHVSCGPFPSALAALRRAAPENLRRSSRGRSSGRRSRRRRTRCSHRAWWSAGCGR